MIAAASETDVVDAVREARESRRTLEIVGNGTKRTFGRQTVCDEVLNVSGLKGVVSYEPHELLLTVGPGTPVVEIDALLAANGQRLGFEPADWGPLLGAEPAKGTIGGAIAADVCGSAAVRYGRVRDHLLGYRAVNGFAEGYKAGGKVVKNVTGFDLPKLMCGAMGTLGVLTEVTLRVFPRPSTSRSFAVTGLDAAAGLALLRRVWSGPLDATGLAYARETAFIRLDGEAAPLAEKTRLLRALAGDLAGTDDPFPAIAGGASLADQSLDVWRVGLPPSHAAQLVAEVAPALWLADWAGGLLWIAGDERVRAAASRLGSHALQLRGRDRAAPFPPEDETRAKLTRAVKSAFDPLALFNPGRMYEGV